MSASMGRPLVRWCSDADGSCWSHSSTCASATANPEHRDGRLQNWGATGGVQLGVNESPVGTWDPPAERSP